MPTVVLKLFAGQGTKRMDGRTDKAATIIMLPPFWQQQWKQNLEFISYSFYPTIAAIFYRNRPAAYTIAIYGRLYTVE